MLVVIALALAGLQIEPDPEVPVRAIWPQADRRVLDFAHPARAVDVALARGRLLVLDEDGELSAWDVPSEKLLWRRWIHFRGVHPLRVALSPDGRKAAVAPRAPPTDVVRVLDTETGEQLRALEFGAAPVFSGDGSTLAAVAGPWVKRWDTASGRELTLLPPAPTALKSAALSPEGRRAVGIAASEVGFYVLDAERRSVEHYSRGESDYGLARAAAFSPDGTRLAVADTYVLAVWSFREGRPAGALRIEPWMRPPLRFLPDGRLLVRSSLRTWCVLGEGEPEELETRRPRGEFLSCSEDGAWLIESEGSLVRLRPREGEPPPAERVHWAGWGPDGAVFLWYGDGRLERWRPGEEPGRPLATKLRDPLHGLNADGTRALLREEGRWTVRDLVLGRDLLRVDVLSMKACAALSADGRFLLAGGKGLELCDVDAPSARPLRAEATPTAAVFSGDGSTLAWADAEGGVTFSGVKGAGELLRFGAAGKPVTVLALSRDGALAVGGDADGNVRLWTDRGGTKPRLLARLEPAVTAVAVCPKGRWAAAGTFTGEIRLLPLAGAAGAVSLRGMNREVRRLAFDAEGRRLLATDGTRGPLIWAVPED